MLPSSPLANYHRAGSIAAANSRGLNGGAKMAASDLNMGDDLPPSDTVRWTPHRKAAVVCAVRSGALILDEACRRYQLSAEEFLGWQEAFETHGIGALSVVRLQHFHTASTRRQRSESLRAFA